MKRANHDLVELHGRVRAETERAVLFYNGDRSVWLPKSQIEVHTDGTITVPEWLAIDKLLV
jgi:RNase P/RNase MRP subunit p29